MVTKNSVSLLLHSGQRRITYNKIYYIVLHKGHLTKEKLLHSSWGLKVTKKC